MSEKKQFVKPNQDYTPEGDSALLEQNIEELGLSEYTLSKLKNVGMEKNIDLARCQMKHFYKIPGMSKKNIFELLKKMQAVGLDFKRSPVAATTTDETNGEGVSEVKTQKEQKPTGNKPNKGNDKKDRQKSANVNSQSIENSAKQQDTKQEQSGREQGQKSEKNKKFDKNKNNRDKNTRDFKDAREGKENRAKDMRDNTSNRQQRENKNDSNAFIQKAIEEQNKLSAQDKKNNVDKKQNVQPQKQAKSLPIKAPLEPKRMKVNSYDIDSILNDNITYNKKTIKQEREEKIAKAIKDLPPIKNADGLYKFYKHGKWGYKTESGKVVIEPTYSEAFNFKEGLACVEQNERCGFINKTGEVVIPIQYDTACSFSEGLASVTKGDKCGYIDKEGNIVFDFVYEAATSFENDIALVKKDGKWGYMDRKTGEIRLR